jgi:hypothetical protein
VSDFHELNDILHRKKIQSTIYFSCRHFPTVADNQGRDICVEKENYTDISTYVSDELHWRLSRSETEKQYLAELKHTIVSRSQGVFQWAALIVALVVQYYNQGSTPGEIMQMLAEVPEKLGDVYMHILSEVVDQKLYQQTLRLMRCVYLAERPLTVTEVCFAMSLPDTELFNSKFSLMKLRLPTHGVMMRRIISLSGGLIEAKQHQNDQIVQLIHQSVNDFLLRDGLQFLGKIAPGDLIGLGHHQLSLICANYITIAEVGNWKNVDAVSITMQLPFLNYATIFWFVHAEKAETRGVPQDYLPRYSQDCSNSIEHWIDLYRILDKYGAAAKGSRAIVQVLLNHKAEINAQGSYHGTALQAAAYRGSQAIVQLLLKHKADVNAQGGFYGNALQAAVIRRSQLIVQLLLNNKAKVTDGALQAAARDDSQSVLQLLLDNKAKVTDNAL